MARDIREKPHSSRSTPLARGERPQGIRKEEARPLRRSVRLQPCRTPQSAQDPLLSQENNGQDTQLQPSQPTSNKRKRSRDTDTSDRPLQRRQRPSSTAAENTYNSTASDSIDSSNPVDYWTKHLRWPQSFFTSETNMDPPLARKKSTSTLRRKSSASSINSSNTTPTQSDQSPRDAKSSTYARPSYEIVLSTKGSFMDEFNLRITDESERLCRTLLEAQQSVPADTLFRDDLFAKTCQSVRRRNESMIFRDITPLICPSAQVLWIHGSDHLEFLHESVNEGWNSAIPFYGPRPQPDYSVGFSRSAFTDEQIKRLEPYVGELTDTFTSYFMGTWQMYFPFLTCEVKCAAAALDVADRQNAHSMTLAVRAIVELFRLVKREKEIDREILAFSISHDTRSVRIYGHFPVINGKDTKYYRHEIHAFDFTAIYGRDKWTAYKFTKNVYDKWMPDHLRRICSAVDQIPLINFDISRESDLNFSGQTSLSQGLESHHLSRSEGSSMAGEDNGSSAADAEIMTPDTSISQTFKKTKRKL